MAEKNGDLNWREKYHDLEGSLQRFRKEAGRVKDLLGVEVCLNELGRKKKGLCSFRPDQTQTNLFAVCAFL